MVGLLLFKHFQELAHWGLVSNLSNKNSHPQFMFQTLHGRTITISLTEQDSSSKNILIMTLQPKKLGLINILTTLIISRKEISFWCMPVLTTQQVLTQPQNNGTEFVTSWRKRITSPSLTQLIKDSLQEIWTRMDMDWDSSTKKDFKWLSLNHLPK